MKTRELLEDPDRQITVPVSLLADCIDIVQDYLSELGDRIDNNDLRRRKTVANEIWNRLSEEIEKPHGRCPMCGDVTEELMTDPAGEYKAGICGACWSRSI